jgi:hypothetical protein
MGFVAKEGWSKENVQRERRSDEEQGVVEGGFSNTEGETCPEPCKTK